MYETPDGEEQLSVHDLRTADRKTQIEVMRSWFFARFEHPANRTPHDSSEGGYQWIWGGPYDAHEELDSEFAGVVPDDVIQDVCAEIEEESSEWAPAESPDDYDDLVIGDIVSTTDHYRRFEDSIATIRRLLNLEIPVALQGQLWKLLFTSVITALETYLSDAFIQTVLSDPISLRKFTETTPEFKKEKVPLSTVLRAADEMESRVKRYLSATSWHNLKRIGPMYHETLGVAFPEDTADVYRAIRVRHDLVHRNGRTSQGGNIEIDNTAVSGIIGAATSFIRHLDKQLFGGDEELAF